MLDGVCVCVCVCVCTCVCICNCMTENYKQINTIKTYWISLVLQIALLCLNYVKGNSKVVKVAFHSMPPCCDSVPCPPSLHGLYVYMYMETNLEFLENHPLVVLESGLYFLDKSYLCTYVVSVVYIAPCHNLGCNAWHL